MVEQWAVDVWRKAVDATDTFIRFKTKPDQAAARVIETAFAEREAAKDAEIARLNETVRRVQASALRGLLPRHRTARSVPARGERCD